MTKHDIPILEQEVDQMPETSIYICENTDCVLDPIEQIMYSLNETQINYGSVVILKNAP